MPDIEYEHGAWGISRMPHFMLERIVEDEALALCPLAGLRSYTDTAAARHVDAEMAPQSRIDRSAVRLEV
jgi:hypothetical protein